ncbi:MAG: choloylglycine hydrolase family protein [Candidatus Babeliales bacterium]
MKKIFITLFSIIILLQVSITHIKSCTSFVLKTKDNSSVYGRTCEWGLFDTKSELVMVPRNFKFTSELGHGKNGMSWKTKYGFIGINGLKKPYYLDGMNEAGLTIGALYLPGFTKYQFVKSRKKSINNMDLLGYILGKFDTVKQIKEDLPKINVIYNEDIIKITKAPMPLHYIVVDSNGDSIVIEYVNGKLKIHYNKIGIMTNSPTYDWHILNLRNYTKLTPYAQGPGDKNINGINFTPFGGGSGMTGLPGDYSSSSRFIRAFFYTQTSIELENIDMAVNQASRILNNFDYPKGFERNGAPDKYSLGYTQWNVIGDIKNKKYYWWTEHNRQMRMVDLNKLNFDNNKIITSPLDKVRKQNIEDRTKDFLIS